MNSGQENYRGQNGFPTPSVPEPSGEPWNRVPCPILREVQKCVRRDSTPVKMPFIPILVPQVAWLLAAWIHFAPIRPLEVGPNFHAHLCPGQAPRGGGGLRPGPFAPFACEMGLHPVCVAAEASAVARPVGLVFPTVLNPPGRCLPFRDWRAFAITGGTLSSGGERCPPPRHLANCYFWPKSANRMSKTFSVFVFVQTSVSLCLCVILPEKFLKS